MKFQDKVHRLYKRHLKIIIEWGGVEEMFMNFSDLDEDLAVKLLFGIKRDNVDFDNLITEVVKEQHDREN